MTQISNRLKTLLVNLFDDPDEEVCVLDTDFNILFVNRALEKKGFTLQNVQGFPSYRVFDHLDGPAEDSSTVEALRKDKVVNKVKRGYDGTDYDIISIPVHDDSSMITCVVELTRPARVERTVSRDLDLRALSAYREAKIESDLQFTTGEILLVLVDPSHYEKKCVEILEKLIKAGHEGICVTYSDKTYDLVLDLQGRKINTDKIRFIDGISIEKGKGCPPVKFCISVYPPKNYQDIYYYAFLTLNSMAPDRFLMYVNLDRLLEYLSHDDLGISLLTTLEKLQANTVQLIVLPENSENRLLEAIIRRLVSRVVRF